MCNTSGGASRYSCGSIETEARRAKFVATWLEALRANATRREMRQAEKKAATHELRCGDIVYSSWGYEQTNVDFYQVVQVVSAKSVRVRRISRRTIETGFMCGITRALKDEFCPDAPMLLCRAEGATITTSARRSSGMAASWLVRGTPESAS